MNKFFSEQPREIGKIQIPDDDILGWLKTLREGGMTDKEIDDILIHLNKEYADQRLPRLVEEALQEYNARRITKGENPLAEGDMLQALKRVARHAIEQELRGKE